jgi:hypothetical protein
MVALVGAALLTPLAWYVVSRCPCLARHNAAMKMGAARVDAPFPGCGQLFSR